MYNPHEFVTLQTIMQICARKEEKLLVNFHHQLFPFHHNHE